MAKEHLGFIGVGRMGGPMAGRLMDDGFSLTICDTSDAAAAPLVARGARRAASPAEVASTVETVLVSLPTPTVVQAVALEKTASSEARGSKLLSISRPPAHALLPRSRRG